MKASDTARRLREKFRMGSPPTTSETKGALTTRLPTGYRGGRKRKAERMAQLNLRVPEEVKDRVRILAARDRIEMADVVIEAIVEDLAVKQRLFADIERAVPAEALLASNTSSLSIGQIAATMTQPARLVGMHFFNPVHLMKLVEVVTHADGSAATTERAVAFARQLGKEPIVVRDSPGFASSRLGVVLGLEAMRMLEQGVATPEDIDKAMELGYNHPMGPLKLTDLVGLDVRLAIAEYLHATLGDAHYAPPKILREKVQKGELGRKTGKGFYTWSD